MKGTWVESGEGWGGQCGEGLLLLIPPNFCSTSTHIDTLSGAEVLLERGPDPDPKKRFLDLMQERIQGESIK